MRKNIVKTVTNARVGFLGNPSDGFNGKTISMPLRNFQAEVVLWQSDNLKFILNSEDQDEYEKLDDMADFVSLNGYYGGIRLIKAAIVSLHKYCRKNKILSPKKNFTISYRSNIPRQSGLAGSSAIIISAIKSIISFYDIPEEQITPAILANIALSAETDELGITAGLQDRVVQSYNQPVFMDFSREAFSKNDRLYGDYVTIPIKLFPDLLIAWNNNPSESGKVHSDVKARFLAGDKKVLEAMNNFASFAEDGYQALLKKDYTQLFDLINQNFDLRRSIYGDQVVGMSNIKMVNLARKLGAAAKFPGSGGAILIMPRRSSDADKIMDEFKKNKYSIERIIT